MLVLNFIIFLYAYSISEDFESSDAVPVFKRAAEMKKLMSAS